MPPMTEEIPSPRKGLPADCGYVEVLRAGLARDADGASAVVGAVLLLDRAGAPDLDHAVKILATVLFQAREIAVESLATHFGLSEDAARARLTRALVRIDR